MGLGGSKSFVAENIVAFTFLFGDFEIVCLACEFFIFLDFFFFLCGVFRIVSLRYFITCYNFNVENCAKIAEGLIDFKFAVEYFICCVHYELMQAVVMIIIKVFFCICICYQFFLLKLYLHENHISKLLN